MGGFCFSFQGWGGAQHPLGPENPVKTIHFTNLKELSPRNPYPWVRPRFWISYPPRWNPRCCSSSATLGNARNANAHWTLQTWSWRISRWEKDCARWKQFSIFKDWQTGPSFVHVHIVHGDMRFASPISIGVSPTLHLRRSFHRSRLIEGTAVHGTRGFRNGSGMSKSARWMFRTLSQLSQTTRPRLAFRISVSCASVNLRRGLSPSYQNRSHFRKFRNWIPRNNIGLKIPILTFTQTCLGTQIRLETKLFVYKTHS